LERVLSENEQDTKSAEETRDVARGALGVSMLTVASRVLGLVRDWCLIFMFGSVAWVTDAFLLAFTIPNLFRRLFGEGALSAAFIPVFVHKREQEGEKPASRLASATLTLLAAWTMAMAGAGVFLCFGLDQVFSENAQVSLTLRLTGVMLPFLCFICCSALMSGMLQSVRSFSVPALMPVILNLCFLSGFYYVYVYYGGVGDEKTIYYVAYAVLLAGILQLVFQWPVLAAKRVALLPRFSLQDEGVRQVLKALGPTALGLGVVQVNVLVDNLIAYALSLQGAHGANTYLYLGNRLMQFPLGVFGIAIASTVFPFLASHAARGDDKALLERVTSALRMVAFIVLPAGIGLAVLADPLVRMIFQRPDLAFDNVAVYRTALVLGCYSAGLVFFSAQHVLTRVYYARKDYAAPVRIAVWMVFVNLALNLILIHAPDLYRRWDVEIYGRWSLAAEMFPSGEALGEAGVALATSITALLNVLLLWRGLKARLAPKIGVESWEKMVGKLHLSFLRIFIGAVAMGLIVYWARQSIPYEPELAIRLERALAPTVVGILIYLAACAVIPIPELGEFVKIRRKKKPDAEKTQS
jgi:putative peptidoglycan lipid II flippase